MWVLAPRQQPPHALLYVVREKEGGREGVVEEKKEEGGDGNFLSPPQKEITFVRERECVCDIKEREEEDMGSSEDTLLRTIFFITRYLYFADFEIRIIVSSLRVLYHRSE